MRISGYMRDPKPMHKGIEGNRAERAQTLSYKRTRKAQRNSRTFSRYFHEEIRRKRGRELQNRKNIVQGIGFQDSDRATNESLSKERKMMGFAPPYISKENKTCCY